MEPTLWNISSLVFKLVIYIGFANAIAFPVIAKWAGFSTDVSKHLKAVLIKFTVLVLIASAGYFFTQVGVMSESGIKGMFDTFMIQLVWSSSIGTTTLYRLLAVLFILIMTSKTIDKITGLYGVSLIFIGLSFCSSGHVAELALLPRFLVAIHVLIALWWMGSFYPLILSCRELRINSISALMHKFGQIASIFVLVLIMAGTYLAYELTGGFTDLTNTRYDHLLILKLILVAHILLLAAFHKFIVVPSLLKNKESRNSLIASIKVELALGVAILITTGIMTTLLGPGHHS